MEGNVNISVKDFEELRQIEGLYFKISTSEYSIVEHIARFEPVRSRIIVSNFELIQDLTKKNNELVDYVKDANRKIVSLQTQKITDQSTNKNEIEIKGFWKRLDWLLNGKVK